MRLVLLSFALFALAGCATGRPGDSNCQPMKLRSVDLTRIQAAAKTQAEIRLDLTTQHVCRHRQKDFFTASFDTHPVQDPDGSERRHSLSCDSDYRRRKPWTCRAWREFRTVRVSATRDAPELRVVIPLDINAELARRYTLQAMSLLTQGGETKACPAIVEGMKTLPEIRTEAEFAADTSRVLASLREILIAGEWHLNLELDPDGFALSNFPLNVHFVFSTAPDNAPRVRCWSETVILITS